MSIAATRPALIVKPPTEKRSPSRKRSMLSEIRATTVVSQAPFDVTAGVTVILAKPLNPRRN